MPFFTPPTREEALPLKGFWTRYSMQVGKSVVKISGVMTLHPFPTLQELAELTEGVDYFIGGYTYEITEAVAADLTAAGFTVDSTGGGGGGGTTDPAGFGEGAFGAGTYGN